MADSLTDETPPRVHFESSPAHTVGVELEVSLLDAQTLALTPRAAEVIAALKGEVLVKPELFQSIVELNTDVCATIADVERDLGAQIARLHTLGETIGLRFLGTGTHPFSHWRGLPITDEPRYRRLVSAMAWPARRLLICGQHVHVGVPSGEHAIAVMNAMTTFIPHILALSASSPFWLGDDTGLASSRIKVFEGLPTAGLPPHVTNWSEFATLMRTLLRSNSITSIREIWWDIRPHPGFGTVEIRIADGVNTLREVSAIAAFIQSAVAYLCAAYDSGEELPMLRGWTLRENKWRAARFGDEMELIRNERGDLVAVRDHILSWVERLRPTAASLGCASELGDVLRILDHRPSYARQRRVLAREGRIQAVVEALEEEFRTGEVIA